MRLYPCAASARNSASVMMLQRFSLQLQRYCRGVAVSARREARTHDGRRQRQSLPRGHDHGPLVAVVNVEAHVQPSRIRSGKFVERGNYTIAIQALHGPPFVVTVRHAEDRASRRARGLRIVGRIAAASAGGPARHRNAWRHAAAAADPVFSRPANRRRDQAEIRAHSRLCPDADARNGWILLVTQARPKPALAKPLETFAHAGKHDGLATEHAFVVGSS